MFACFGCAQCRRGLGQGPIRSFRVVVGRSFPFARGLQQCARGKIAKVAELVDAPDLGSDAARREGSSPISHPTKIVSSQVLQRGNGACNICTLDFRAVSSVGRAVDS